MKLRVYRGTGSAGLNSIRPSIDGVYGTGIYFYDNVIDARSFAEPGGGIISAEVDLSDPGVKVVSDRPVKMVGSNIVLRNAKIIVVQDASSLRNKKIVRESLMGPFETQIETLATNEGFLDPIRRFVGRLLAPVRDKLNAFQRVANALPTIGDIWKKAQDESGEKMPVTPMMRQAGNLGGTVDSAAGEIRAAIKVEDLQPLPEDQQLDESLGLTAVLGLTLGAIGGLPLLLGGLAKIAKLLRLTKTANALESAHVVVHHIEQKVVDVVIPDRLSFVLYVKAWNAGFRSSKDLLTFEEYRTSTSRARTESVMYSLLLIYFAWHGILGALHYGASLLGSAEATASAVKGVEIVRGVKDATGILRGKI